MLTLYTTTGDLIFQKDKDGTMHPMVINNHREYALSEQELLLWSSLAFKIYHIHELESAYENLLQKTDVTERMTFSYCLNRLLLRGLVQKGEGLTGMDALYQLLGKLHIRPINTPFIDRLVSCIHLFLKGKIRLSDVRIYLRKEPFSKEEKTVLEIASRTPLTTAELLTCMDRNLDIHSSKELMDTLYADSETTYQTLAENAQIHHIQARVLQTICELYSKRLLLFQQF